MAKTKPSPKSGILDIKEVTKVIDKQRQLPGYSRFGEFAYGGAAQYRLAGNSDRKPRKRKISFHGSRDKYFDFQDATILRKQGRHGWVQPTECNQKWVAYYPQDPLNFRAQQFKTRKAALIALAGWLGFTTDETYKHAN